MPEPKQPTVGDLLTSWKPAGVLLILATAGGGGTGFLATRGADDHSAELARLQGQIDVLAQAVQNEATLREISDDSMQDEIDRLRDRQQQLADRIGR